MRPNLRDPFPFASPVPQLLHPSIQRRHDPSIATVRFPGQELQDSRHAALVWSETMTPTDQSSEATATLPGVAVPPRSQYPVSWFECRGVVVGIGDSELFKFIDDKQIGKPPRTKTLAFPPSLPQRAREYFNMVGNVLLTSV